MSSRPVALLVALALVLLLVPATASAQEAPSPPGTPAPAPRLATPLFSPRRVPNLLVSQVADQRLRRAVDEALATAPSTSCLVISDGARPLVRVRGDVPVQPASTTKLLTGFAVLDHIPADRRLATVVSADRAPTNGVVEGNLYVVGGGDPLLTTPGYQQSFRYRDQPVLDPAALADRVRAAGVTEVRGDIVGDDSRYDSERAVPSWPSRYTRQDTVGPLSALMINDGVTGYEDAPAQPSAERQPGDPPASAAATVKTLLEERGVTVEGEGVAGRAPADGVELARLESLPVADLVGEMEGWSDNTTAELLTKELGRETSGTGSTAAGLDAVRSSLDAAGLPTTGLTLHDGSGLDAGNLLTCDLLTAVLDRSGPDSPLGRGLAVAGERGTMRPRLQGSGLEGRVHAKTGTLTSPPVVSLAGFLTTDAGSQLTFSFVQNGPEADAYLQDAVLAAAARYPDAPDPATLGPLPPRS